jgi:hypothetical protein
MTLRGGNYLPLFVYDNVKGGREMMECVISKLRIALDRPFDRTSVSVKKKDANTRQLHFTLTQGGAVYKLDKVNIAAIKGIKPDGSIFYNGCVIDGNEVQYTITEQSISVEGTVKCELVLYGTAPDKVQSATFEIEVYDNLFDDDVIESQDEFGIIHRILADSEEVLDKTIAYAKQAEQSKNASAAFALGIRYAYPRIQNIRISFTDCSSDFIFVHKEILIPEETVFWGTPIRGTSGVYEKSADGKCIEYIKIFSGGGAESGITITGITLTMIRPDRTEAEEYSFTPTELTVKSDNADISYGDGTCRIECSGPYQGAYIYLPCIANISYEEMKALHQLIDSEELDQEVRKSINETN